MKTFRNLINNTNSLTTNPQVHVGAKPKSFVAKVAKLYQPCLPILGVGKKTRMVLAKTPAVPPQTKTTLAELREPSLPSSPRGSSVNQMAEAGGHEREAADSPRRSSVNQMAEEIGEGLRREIATELAKKEIVDLEAVKKHFTAKETSRWGHENPDLIAQWVEQLATNSIDTTSPKNAFDQKVYTWITQHLETPIAEQKAKLHAANTPWGQALLDDEFKKTLLNLLLQTNADPELEDEAFQDDLMNKVETVLAQTEYPDFSLQLDTGKTVTLPGAYMKTKAADWHTKVLPLITELKNALTEETEHIKSQSKDQDWEDVLQTQNLKARFALYPTGDQLQELTQQCPELFNSLIQKTLEAPENYAAHFTTQEGVKIEVRDEEAKARGKDWRTNTFPEEVKTLEHTIEAYLQELLDIRENSKDNRPWNQAIADMQIRPRVISHLTNPFKNKSTFGFEFPSLVEHLADSKLNNTKNHFFYHKSRYGTTSRIASDVTKALELEDSVHTTILETQKLLFAQKTPWKLGRSLIKRTLAKELERTLDLDEPHTALAQTLINEALQHNQGYELFSTNRQFDGGYFKRKNPKTNEYLMSNTLVMGAHGQMYELLNTLSQKDSDEIQNQHKQQREAGQTVIGKGSFGKVRFAKDINTGDILAVKKLHSYTKYTVTSNRQTIVDSRKSSTHEIQKMQMIQDRIAALPRPEAEKEAILNLFATHKDYAHIPSIELTREDHEYTKVTELANKSYIFSPFANLGDGERALEDLSVLKTTDRKQANEWFLDLAKSYTTPVAHLHELGIHHRDIKPENFLHTNVEESVTHHDGRTETRVVEHIKLADFGLAHDAREANIPHGGTPAFSPPELLTNRHLYNAEKHDCFSLGITLQRLKQGLSKQELDEGSETILIKGQLQPLKLTLRYQDGRIQPYELKLNAFNGRVRYSSIPSSQLKNLDMAHMDSIIAMLIASSPRQRISAEQALAYMEALDPNQDHLA